MSGALCAAANMTAAPVPPLLAGILFNGSTADAHFNVTHYDGDTYADFGAAYDLSYSGGLDPVSLSYDVTANSGQGFCANTGSRTFFGQAGATLSTSALMAMAWGINSGALSIGENASVTVRCKAVDSLGTTVYSSPITVSVTRTS
jgi:hypothetical protein